MQVCIVYVVKKVVSFWGAWSINGRGERALKLYRPAGRKKLLVNYVETGTNSYSTEIYS